MTLNIFITGATGYLGGEVLGRLLVHPERDTFLITALVRDAKKAERLQAEFGVKPVVGSLDDAKLVEDAAANADVIIHTANADHVPSIKAIIAGTERRYKATGQAPFLIHNSGAGVFIDNALGMNSTDVVYSDTNVSLIESVPDNAPHRPVDLLVIAADKAGYARTCIILPGIVYGNPSSLAKSGFANGRSILVPLFIRIFTKLGRVNTIGEGKNIWPTVEVNDLVDFYILLFDSIRQRPEEVGHGSEGYYIGENGEGEMREVLEAIGVALAKRGKVGSSESKPFSDAEVDATFGPIKFVFGGNARSKGDRARALGWKPKHTHADFLASIDSEVDAVLGA